MATSPPKKKQYVDTTNQKTEGNQGIAKKGEEVLTLICFNHSFR